jgi:hypothetical protein
LQNIVKNLERQEVRDWLSSTKDLLMEEKKVNMILTFSLKGRWKRETMGSGRSQMLGNGLGRGDQGLFTI